MRALLVAALCAVVSFSTYAGDRATIERGNRGEAGGDKELTAKDIEAKLKAAKLTFKWEDKPLAAIVKDISDKTGVKITLSPKSKAGNVSIEIANQDGVQALHLVSMMSGTNVTYKDGEVIVE